MDYDFSRLSWRSFEQLIQAVGSKILGPGLVVFGDGPDGGREAAINADLPYPTDSEHWSGYTLVQVKFLQRPKDTTSDGQWALGMLGDELSKYEDGERDLPENMIFATNVVLSAVETSGAKDRAFALAAEAGVPNFDVWDYDKLRTFLDTSKELRRAFGPYVLAGDVLAEAMDLIDEIKSERPDFDEVMSRFLQKELLADQWVNLEQAGRSTEDQVPVSRVFVDLPVAEARQADPPEEEVDALEPGFVSRVLDTASRRLDPEALSPQRGTQDSAQRQSFTPEARLVLVGGPGQGKTTIGQFVCQMFRASLLRSRDQRNLAPEVKDTLEAIEQHVATDGLELPGVRRFPLRIELTKVADSLGDPEGCSSLLSYIATAVSSRVDEAISASLMARWLGSYPWLLILDGLDEVPASGNREQLMTAIREFWVDIAEATADCLVIATTRPQGYEDDFSPRYYEHLYLTPLSTARALHYADRLLHVRFATDEDRRSDIGSRLARAASRSDTGRLMTSPLQVTIMATLLERMGQPPEGRWNLFSQYYRVIYDRELEREISAAWVLRDHRPDIDAIHRRVGLLLQAESENASQAEAQISRARFAEIVRARLKEEELDDDEHLVGQIIDAAMDRLVFLVPVEADHVGFEIRSLQEFMAAEALLDGREEIVEKRLRLIAPLSAWRNVFLFAAGRCFTDLQHYRDTINTICGELNDPTTDMVAPLALPGSALAIDLLADGVANRQTKYERLLSREALRVARMPPGELSDRLAEVYKDVLRPTYDSELSAVVSQGPFIGTLGAWRTLAVLQARGESWAREILRQRFPASGDLGQLLKALPIHARSKWLAEQLATACSNAAPSQSLPFRDAIRGLDVLEYAPGWYRFFFELTAFRLGHFSGRQMYFENASIDSLSAGLRMVDDMDGQLKEAAAQLNLGERDFAPSSWELLFSGMEFLHAPSASTLATILERLAEKTDLGLDAYSGYTAWPLTILVTAATEGFGEFQEFASRARAGEFADVQEWMKAEERWRGAGILMSDLARKNDEKHPFDDVIADSGFPLSTATITVTGSGPNAAVSVLPWLRIITQPEARRFATYVCFWLLRGFEDEETDIPFSFGDLARVIGGDDLRAGFMLPFKALNRFKWNPSLDADEWRLLEAMGRQFESIDDFEEAMTDKLKEALVEKLVSDQSAPGLFRLLAIGLPYVIQEQRDALESLLPGPEGDEAAPARALLALKLGVTPEDEDLDALAKSPNVWIEDVIGVLRHAQGADYRGAIAISLNGLLPDHQWANRGELLSTASSWIGTRSSGLASAGTWESLELFSRQFSSHQ